MQQISQAAATGSGGLRFKDLPRPDDGAIGHSLADIHNHLGILGEDVRSGAHNGGKGFGDDRDTGGSCLVQCRGERLAFVAGGVGWRADNDPGPEKSESLRPGQRRPEQVSDPLRIDDHAIAQGMNGEPRRWDGQDLEFFRGHADKRGAQINGYFAAPEIST
ncbi:MAG: hypothetical protein Kow00100_02090 [Geothermobacteraceae bacterium]